MFNAHLTAHGYIGPGSHKALVPPSVVPAIIFHLAADTLLGLAGCMTQQAYDGPKLARDEVAHISGDLRFTAGAPVSALLRQVDGRALSISQSGVDVDPGSHELLVDCVVRETGSTSRFSLDVDVIAGRRYRLVPEARRRPADLARIPPVLGREV